MIPGGEALRWEATSHRNDGPRRRASDSVRQAVVGVYSRAARYSLARGRIPDARRFARAAFGAARPLGPLHAVPVLLLASQVEEQAGALGAAYAFANQALAVLPGPATTPERGSLRAHCLYQLGMVTLWQGNWPRAEDILLEAVETAGRMCGQDSVDVAQAYNALGMNYKFWGRYDAAAAAYQEAERRLNTPALRVHPLRATLLHNLGGLAFSRGTHAEGETFATDSVKLRSELLGADHPHVIADLAARAALLAQQGHLDQAATDLERAATAPGMNPLDRSVAINNLGVIEARRGNLSRAEDLLTQALAAKEEILGADAIDVAATLINLIDLHQLSGRPDQARTIWERADAIVRHHVRNDHPVAQALAERDPQASA